MKQLDYIPCLLWIALGTLFIVGGVRLKLWRVGIPGPGFLPFLVGVILLFLSFCILVGIVTNKTPKGKATFPEIKKIKKGMITLILLFAYAFSFRFLGFVVTTFLFFACMLTFVERQKWSVILIFAIFASIISYITFSALGIEFPRGIFGM